MNISSIPLKKDPQTSISQKHSAILTVTLLILIPLIFSTLLKGHFNDKQNIDIHLENLKTYKSSNSSQVDDSSRDQSARNINPKTDTYASKSVPSKKQGKTAWTSYPPLESPKLKAHASTRSVENIIVNHNLLQNLEVAEYLSISIPEYGVMDIEVTDKSINQFGDISFIGESFIKGETYETLITTGPNATFAFIDTPDGYYEMTAHNNHGIIHRKILQGIHDSVNFEHLPILAKERKGNQPTLNDF